MKTASNACKSVHYAGMTLFFAQILALVYFSLRPGLAGILLLLALTGLLGAGLARLYCATYERFARRHPALRLLLALRLGLVFRSGLPVCLIFVILDFRAFDFALLFGGLFEKQLFGFGFCFGAWV